MKYTDEYTKEISFPIGGIGTGCIGLSGDGRLIDWEIFNLPSKGSINGYSHFAIRAINKNIITAAVLNGDLQTDYSGQYEKHWASGYGLGPNSKKMCGFPHFKNVVFNGEFPMSEINFSDEKFPANITLQAFNPFIPCDAKNSSIPAAFFEITICNTTEDTITYQTALSVSNPYKQSKNEVSKKSGCEMITFYNDISDKNDINYGELTAATSCDKTYTQTYWYRSGWKDNIVSFWNDFSSKIDIPQRTYKTSGSYDTGTLIAEVTLAPKEKKKVKFVLSWNIPNNHNYWNCDKENEKDNKWKNYYATIFENSEHTALYSLKNWDDLYRRTLKFKNALHSSTLPKEVIDAASSNLSVLKSPTVFRLEDGTFYGFEGVHEQLGSCEGTCQHVYNYAYAMCFLFPELERSIRDMFFKYSTDENGRMGFRVMLPLGRKMTDFRACVDGQMGEVLKCYREWKISGNTTWLKNNWENIKKVLEYAWSPNNEDAWDKDKDGVLEGRQHHTLDMELFGPSSWLEGFYLAALKAAAEMGEFLGYTQEAAQYRALFEKGYNYTKENLFNGKYFIQKIDITDKTVTDKFNASDVYWNDETNQIKYQIANGSSIDQVLAQWHADLLGLGDIFDKKQLSCALSEMMKNNFKPNMRYVVNPWRIFCLNDEAGTQICSYPTSTQKPDIPIPYCEETMTGFEYSFAGLLFSRGKIEDGLKVVKAIRDRFDGKKRNPYNEFECGSNYARSMASYALIPLLCGFEFDMPRFHIGFNPYVTDKFCSIWSVDNAWGVFEIADNTITLSVYEGEITLCSLGLKFCKSVSNTKIDNKNVNFEFKDGKLMFEKTKITDYLRITL